jgi:hypothetical protein
MPKTEAERSRDYRLRHPKQAKASARKWRRNNQEVMALLNTRNKYVYKGCVEFVKRQHPDVFKLLRKEAKQRWPVSDLGLLP